MRERYRTVRAAASGTTPFFVLQSEGCGTRGTPALHPARGVRQVKKLLAELRRRNVWRAGLLYLGAMWALAQGVSELTPAIGLPVTAARWLVVAAAIGLPFWLLFAWFYELTPEGFKLERQVPQDASIARQTGRRLDYLIIAVLAVAVVLLLTDRVVSSGPDPAAGADARSIAVLPLVNAGGNPADEYFSDGLSEELISGLTRIADLRVIGRSSAFEFKGSTDPRSTIAAKLGVAHLLEGNVRRDGDRVRIMLELIRPGDGTSLWSQTYSREMQDIFAVQADIARSVAAALQVQFGEDAVDYTRPPGGNVAAYEAALQGRALARQSTAEGYEKGVALLRQAVQLEPEYAFAHALLANALVNLARVRGRLNDAGLQAEAAAASEAAVRLAPDYPASHLARGYFEQMMRGDMDVAGTSFRRARELAPNDGGTAMFLALYLRQLGRHDESVALVDEAIPRDPLRVDWRLLQVYLLYDAGRFQDAFEATRRVLAITPDNPVALHFLAFELRHQGRFGESVEAIRRAIASEPARMDYRADLAYALAGDGRTDEAIQSLREALAGNPDHADLHLAMGNLMLWHGRYAQALEHGRRAMQANPQIPLYRFGYAQALANLDRFEEAERVLRDGLAGSPHEPLLNAALADVAAQRGDTTTVHAAARAETHADARRYVIALAAAMDGDLPALEAGIGALVDSCRGRKVTCLSWAAAVRAHARQDERMYALLAQLEREPGYRPSLGDRYFRPYYADPRYLAHLGKYGRSPPPLSPPAG